MSIITGMATSSQGMIDELNSQQILANNIANMTTTGFKADSPVIQDFGQQLVAAYQQPINDGSPLAQTQIGSMTTDQRMGLTGLNLQQGSLVTTNQPLDLALAGNGFFAVRTAQGNQLTRDGHFHLSSTGSLVNSAGDAVLSTAGTPITVPHTQVTPLPPGSLSVRRDGSVWVQGKKLATIAVGQAGPAQGLKEVGGGFYSLPAGTRPQPAPATLVVQGALENSNVDLTATMTAMLSMSRSYDLNQKMVQMQDLATSTAVDQVGRVG